MQRQFSAGGIVYKKDSSGVQVLLIQNTSIVDEHKSYWGFPKGHIEPEEKSDAAALREVKEETNIDAQIVKKLGQSKYTFTWQGEKIFKVVIYFLMKYISGDVKHQVEELESAQWVKAEEAMNLLSFKKDKVFLEQALKELSHG